MTARQRSAGRGEPRELKLQRVDLCQVASGVVVAAALAASQPEPAAREVFDLCNQAVTQTLYLSKHQQLTLMSR